MKESTGEIALGFVSVISSIVAGFFLGGAAGIVAGCFLWVSITTGVMTVALWYRRLA